MLNSHKWLTSMQSAEIHYIFWVKTLSPRYPHRNWTADSPVGGLASVLIVVANVAWICWGRKELQRSCPVPVKWHHMSQVFILNAVPPWSDKRLFSFFSLFFFYICRSTSQRLILPVLYVSLLTFILPLQELETPLILSWCIIIRDPQWYECRNGLFIRVGLLHHQFRRGGDEEWWVGCNLQPHCLKSLNLHVGPFKGVFRR